MAKKTALQRKEFFHPYPCATWQPLFLYFLITTFFYFSDSSSVSSFISTCSPTCVKAAEIAREAGAKVLIDADHYQPELLEHIGLIDVFIASEFVYEALFQDQNYEANCAHIRDMGPSVVIFTLGSQGCVGLGPDGFFSVPVYDDWNGAFLVYSSCACCKGRMF